MPSINRVFSKTTDRLKSDEALLLSKQVQSKKRAYTKAVNKLALAKEDLNTFDSADSETIDKQALELKVSKCQTALEDSYSKLITAIDARLEFVTRIVDDLHEYRLKSIAQVKELEVQADSTKKEQLDKLLCHIDDEVSLAEAALSDVCAQKKDLLNKQAYKKRNPAPSRRKANPKDAKLEEEIVAVLAKVEKVKKDNSINTNSVAVEDAPSGLIRYRLKAYYDNTVKDQLVKHFNYTNVNQVPKIDKILLNMGLGDVKDDAKKFASAVEELKTIGGQKPIVTKAKKSVANFKVRQGSSVGAKITLRGNRMYEFLDKLISIALPRVRDFRGLNPNSFDGRGNYAMGIKEQLIFPEIKYDQIDKIRGFDICIVTTAKTDEEAKALLTYMGLPFSAQ